MKIKPIVVKSFSDLSLLFPNEAKTVCNVPKSCDSKNGAPRSGLLCSSSVPTSEETAVANCLGSKGSAYPATVAKPLRKLSLSDLNSYRASLRNADTPSYEELYGSYRLHRCLRTFAWIERILYDVGLPCPEPHHRKSFRDFVGRLVAQVDRSLVKHLDLQFLATSGKACRNSVAHGEQFIPSGSITRSLVTRLEGVALILVDAYHEFLTRKQCDETAGDFYKFLTARCASRNLRKRRRKLNAATSAA